VSVKTFLEKTVSDVLGILDFDKLSQTSDGKLEGDLIELLIKLRTDAKKEKNYALADKIRNELNELGVILEDSKDRTIYKITNK
jgi:cysteinyl-tRNA synthetase